MLTGLPEKRWALHREVHAGVILHVFALQISRFVSQRAVSILDLLLAATRGTGGTMQSISDRFVLEMRCGVGALCGGRGE